MQTDSAQVISFNQAKFPYWMPSPARWVWCSPEGKTCGFGLRCVEPPGLANLLWLAMDLPKPPGTYDVKTNPLYLWAILNHKVTINGVTLADLAGETLPNFCAKLQYNNLPAEVVALREVAERKAKYANT
jgi:hypothetical protein